ncbi:TPA: hypothetical protein ACN32D_002142 [Vibrio parahaemolyticus]|uniref:hypothetical protein n=1 Tax=Vibrio parahaemolyticus TaxID=670 RepID=UPI000472096B|nr:hypothetical protein [Vibrio parahaemolyticus]KIT46443.1 hypothetical protein H337_06910 [Vibrio parahaemolyticus EN9701121]EGQ7913853.1 hypothetical protein [Vibrio parahaemolyticus]EGQ9863337.1 hypothetical protein [Vibrio parahaemolyticus]EGW0142853.1 hypothetical protein [Vibrio parahaemolyticus]EHB9909302.1 hypothetical protein [Vibrio parahaemolyticus]
MKKLNKTNFMTIYFRGSDNLKNRMLVTLEPDTLNNRIDVSLSESNDSFSVDVNFTDPTLTNNIIRNILNPITILHLPNAGAKNTRERWSTPLSDWLFEIAEHLEAEQDDLDELLYQLDFEE